MAAFVYKWTNKTNNMWYVGSRTAKNCHVDDGYICSSKLVKPMILADRSNWEREIIDTGTRADMIELEEFILYETQAPYNTQSYNRSYANMHILPSAPWNKGLTMEQHPSIQKQGEKCRETKKRNYQEGRVAPWNKGLKGVQTAWNKGLPKECQPKYGKPGGMKGKKQSQLNKDTAKKSIAATNKKLMADIRQCPHCEYYGYYTPRWHWDRCRHKEGS